MAEEVPAAAAPAKAPAKSPKKKAAPRPKKDGPTLPNLIIASVAASKERKGISLAAVKKALGAKGVDLGKTNKRINITVTKLVANGTLSQTKGIGASGSFKLAQKEAKATKKPVKAKKPVVKKSPAKAKKIAAKKSPAKAKKPAAKKVAAKASPKKKVAPAKKAAAKKPAAKKSPKKAPAKKPLKKTATKKPAAKKTPVKKAAAKKSKK